MLNNIEMDRLPKRYVLQTLLVVVLLLFCGISLAMLAHIEGLAAPLTVGVVFSLVVEVADVLIWRKVKKSGSEDALVTFFSALSGFRMLLALATMGGCWLVVGRAAMTKYVLVFLVFYLWIIIHHSTFFMRMSNSHPKCDNENK